MFRIRGALLAIIAFMTFALPLAADLGGITTTPINLPAKVYASIVGPDENLWILTDKGNLGKVTPGGSYTEFPLQFGRSVFSLASGIDGNFWIAGNNGHVERVTTNGVVTDFAVAPSFYFPDPMVSGSDGAIWFYANQNPAPGGSNTWKLGRIDIYEQFKTYDLGISDLTPSGDFLRGLVSGGDGNLWFIDETRSQVVKFSMVTKSIAGTYAIPPSSGSADQMTLGWDGNVWFTRGSSIDRVTVDGKITEFPIPSGGKPVAILMSGDGNIWFTEPSSGKLGQLVMSSITAGGTATINETAFIPDVEEIFLNLPPAFAGSSGTAQALATTPNDTCPPFTKLGVGSILGNPIVITIPTPPPCYDETKFTHVLLTFPKDESEQWKTFINLALAIASPPGSNSVRPRASAAGSGAVTATINISAPPGTTISSIDTSDPSLTTSFSGLTASITKSSMATGDSFTAAIHVTGPPGAQSPALAGAIVASSSIPDSNPLYHVVSFFVDGSSLGGRVALPPNSPNIVITPVARGK